MSGGARRVAGARLGKGPLLLISAGTGYGGAERCLEIVLRHLPPHIRVTILAESRLHLAALAAQARPEVEVVVVDTTTPEAIRDAARRLAWAWLRLWPRAVLTNTQLSARLLAAVPPWLRGLRCRSFVYVHDFQWFDMEALFARLERATVLVPDRVVLERPGYLDRFVRPGGRRRAVELPCPFELPAEAPGEPPPDAPFLHLATVNPWKGHTHLIEAVAKARAAGADLRVESYGFRPDPHLLSLIEAQIADAGLGEAFALRDHVDDPAPLLRACFGVVIAAVSHSGGPESFGRTMVEAWAWRRPVIAFAAGAPGRLIRHEVDGLLVPEGDAAALAAAMLRLRNDPSLCRRLAENGEARARAEFGVEIIVPRLLDVLAGGDG
ncbi:MAG: glycosyltransferase family 4 protein [Rhodospirillaceae bacterium]|nr:glycosyltransferase family 4 protein [Rhodospirillaceae bacterium]